MKNTEKFTHSDGRWARLWDNQLAIKGKFGTRTIRISNRKQGRTMLLTLGFVANQTS